MAKDKASGDDMSQRDKDANGFTIASEMTTGGQSRDMSEGGTMEVGYGADVDQAGANKG